MVSTGFNGAPILILGMEEAKQIEILLLTTMTVKGHLYDCVSGFLREVKNMLNAQTVSRNVLIYLREQGNEAEGYCTDQCGRFILPLNWVTFGQNTDEGPQILLNGIVRQICGDDIYIEPIGFDLPLQERRADSCINHPNGILLVQLMSYFTAANMTVLQGQRLHLNGEELCFVK